MLDTFCIVKLFYNELLLYSQSANIWRHSNFFRIKAYVHHHPFFKLGVVRVIQPSAIEHELFFFLLSILYDNVSVQFCKLFLAGCRQSGSLQVKAHVFPSSDDLKHLLQGWGRGHFLLITDEAHGNLLHDGYWSKCFPGVSSLHPHDDSGGLFLTDDGPEVWKSKS